MYQTIVNNKSFTVTTDSGNFFSDEKLYDWDIKKIRDNYYHIIKDNKTYKAELLSYDAADKVFHLKINGRKMEVKVKDKLDLLLEKLGMSQALSSQIKEIKAPMPGLILEIMINEGTEVKKGDPLMILEAMKMENVLKAPGEGTVKSIKVKKGQSVEKNQVLIQF